MISSLCSWLSSLPSHLFPPEERALALRVMRLPEVLTQLEDDLLPSRLIEPYLRGVDDEVF